MRADGLAFVARTRVVQPAEDYRRNVTIVIYTVPGRDVVDDLRAYKRERQKNQKGGRGRRRSTLLTTGRERERNARRRHGDYGWRYERPRPFAFLIIILDGRTVLGSL